MTDNDELIENLQSRVERLEILVAQLLKNSPPPTNAVAQYWVDFPKTFRPCTLQYF